MHNADLIKSSAGRSSRIAAWPIPAMVGGAVAFLFATSLCGESLWVDELHSSWTVSGSLNEVSQRAAAGNQTPPYFYLLYLLNWLNSETLGHAASCEQVLRFPSAVAWALTIAISITYLFAPFRRSLTTKDRRPNWPIWIVATTAFSGLVLFDRLQLFYASEARPYAGLQLLNLLAWLYVIRFIRQASAPHSTENRRWTMTLAMWVVLATLCVAWHLTAIFSIACQWWVMAVAASPRSKGRWRVVVGWIVAGLAVATILLPLAWTMQHVWVRRQAWATFADQSSWRSAVAILPFSTILIAVPAMHLLELLSSMRGSANKDTMRRRHIAQRFLSQVQCCVHSRGVGESWIWLAAGLGPWLMVWLVTAWDIAPLMHPRYLVTSAIPMVLWGASTTLSRRSSWLVGGVMCLVIGNMVYQQGTVGVWQSGYLVGGLRGEGWRSANGAAFSRCRPGDQLWCAAGLIEGRLAADEVGAEINEYLSYPLRGCYDRAGVALSQNAFLGDLSMEPNGLVSDWREWPRQWQLSPLELSPSGVRWIVFRGSSQNFERILDSLASSDAVEIVEPIQTFGKVAVAGVR